MVKIIKYCSNSKEIDASIRHARIVVADLDGTLAISKSALDDMMAQTIAKLLRIMKFAVISGGNIAQFEKQLLAHLKCDKKLLQNLYLFPTNATAFYKMHNSVPVLVYAENLTKREKSEIISAMESALEEAGFSPEKTYGEIIEDRGTQITFSALGQNAPIELKSKWDPERKKRAGIKKLMEKRLRGFQISIGGTTSIDISRKGIDKAYGIKKITEVLGYKKEEMLYVGDSLFKGGNDYPAATAGVTCISVKSIDDTRALLERVIKIKGE
ncbi:MAG: HAD-IIB family hydrolase [Methanothrix sp.]